MNDDVITPSFELSHPSISEEKFKNKYLLMDMHRILNFIISVDIAANDKNESSRKELGMEKGES